MVQKVCYEVPFDKMVIVWTPSMYIVVDGIVSTCHTDEADPRAVNVLNYLCQTRLGGYLYGKLEEKIHDTDSLLRKTIETISKRKPTSSLAK